MRTAVRLSISPQPRTGAGNDRHNQSSPWPDVVRPPTSWEGGCLDHREAVDDRDKPGQGELELFLRCHRQPSSVNPTAVDLAPAEGLYDRRQYAE
jgi:hypothetical protein